MKTTPDHTQNPVPSEAQETVRESEAQSPENQEMMSLKETQRMVFELKVHQIELEMQNEMLRLQSELAAALIAKKQMSVLQSQIKPHFLYNALNAIISLCYTDGPKAGELLTRFSQYLRIVFDYNSQEEMVPIKKELELVEVYADIEKVRYGERLITTFDVDPALLDQKIMSLILQPLVENAIRHGVSKKTEGGTVKLRVKRCSTFIKVTISDNGVGMSKTLIHEIMERDDTELGVGIANINQRLYLNTGKKMMIRSREGKGTTIMLFLPLYENDQASIIE